MATTWITQKVHGNSKRQCEIKRSGNSCGSRATLMTYPESDNKEGIFIFHCADPRHVANAHKQITELVLA